MTLTSRLYITFISLQIWSPEDDCGGTDLHIHKHTLFYLRAHYKSPELKSPVLKSFIRHHAQLHHFISMSRDHLCACSWVPYNIILACGSGMRDLSVVSHALKFHSLTLAILPNWALGLWEVWKPLVAKLRERRNSGGGSYSSGRPVTPQLSNYTAWNVSIDSQNKIIK